eukprot:COSAG01_NODE_65351_length_273_cov_1.195402_1_plen_24_part_10
MGRRDCAGAGAVEAFGRRRVRLGG